MPGRDDAERATYITRRRRGDPVNLTTPCPLHATGPPRASAQTFYLRVPPEAVERRASRARQPLC